MPTCPQCRTAYPAETLVCPGDGTSLTPSQPMLTDALGDTLESPSRHALSPSGQRAIAGRDSTAPDALLGATLAGRYTITRRIGEGGMGVVYAAEHAVIGRTVAVKVLREKFIDRPEVASRLKNEAQLASSIRHAHIIDVFDFGEIADGRTFVVMELLDGEPLSARLRAGPLPEGQVIEVGLQIASALGAAHAQGVIHRDVKPENVFVTRRGDADFLKVVDFGISRTIKVDAEGNAVAVRLTQTGMVLGTPLYMSPEQARGEDDLDQRIDVYALGVILYECLTADVPFRGSNYLGIIAQVIANAPVPPRELRPELPISAAIERVVLKALAKKREDRYASMAELGADLERVRDGKPSLAPRPRTPGRSRAVLLPALAVGVLLVGAVGGIAVSSRPRTPSVASEVAPATSTTPGAPAAPAAAARPVPATLPSPSASVILRFNSTPTGAEIFDGARRLGTAPTTLELARSSEKLHLRFHLEGYEEGLTEIAPQLDGETVNVELQPLPPKKPPQRRPSTRSRPAMATPRAPSPATSPSSSETAPNPFH